MKNITSLMSFILFSFCSMLTCFHATVFANDAGDKDYLFEHYAQFSQSTIVDISDNIPYSSIGILLSDGTLWDCYYQTYAERQQVLQHWKIGQKAFISAKHLKSSEEFGIYVTGTKVFVELMAILDYTSADALACITEISNGKIVLSDGSEWKENSLLYYSSGYWNLGDRIVVTCRYDRKAFLINIDHPRGLILDSYYTEASLTDWNF